jgi:uncharacterized protein YndB with AHSA1/START domain
LALDLAAHMGAMTRAVRNLERDGKPVKAVIATCLYDTGVADLWDALTNRERLPRWFLPVTGELKLGGRYQFQGNAGGTVTECVPQKKIAATWEFGGGVTWVTVTLTPDGEKTRLELEHVAPIDPHWGKFGPGAVGVGWEIGLMGLARHLADPAAPPPPPEVAMAWSTTDEGKSFVGVSSAGWGEADIASGETPAEAREAAENTRRAYTGEAPPG